MANIIKDLIYTAFGGSNIPLPQHEKQDGSMLLTGENNPLPTQLTGSIVEELDITSDVGTITSGTTIEYSLPPAYANQFLFASVKFRRSSGYLESITMRHTAQKSGINYPGFTEEAMQFYNGEQTLNVTGKAELLTGNFVLIFKAPSAGDFVPTAITLHLWRKGDSKNTKEYYGKTVTERPSAKNVPIGSVYTAVDTQELWQSNGVAWVVV